MRSKYLAMRVGILYETNSPEYRLRILARGRFAARLDGTIYLIDWPADDLNRRDRYE